MAAAIPEDRSGLVESMFIGAMFIKKKKNLQPLNMAWMACGSEGNL